MNTTDRVVIRYGIPVGKKDRKINKSKIPALFYKAGIFK